MVLERDDANDFILVNGKKIASPIREEILTIRGIVPGEYTVNISHVQATTGRPVPATVKVQKLNPTTQVIFDNTVLVDHTGDEKIAVRFTLWAKLPRTEHWTRCLPPGASRPKQNIFEHFDLLRRCR